MIKSIKSEFIVKKPNSLSKQAGGMVRSDTTDKIDYSLALDGPMFRRLAIHLTKGADIYGKRNWMKATTEKDESIRYDTLNRFRESAIRHFMQWLEGDNSEDHLAAVWFNTNAYAAMEE